MGSPTANSEEFDRQKQEWQEELDQMSEFLVLKSTEEQKEDGVEKPVDTAFVDTSADGKPVLKARFDVHHFKEEEVTVTVEEGQLKLLAQCTDDRDTAVFRKTMVRTMDLPKNADTSAMTQTVDDKGVLTITMPFVLPARPRPSGPNVYPIVKDTDGKRKIRLVYMIGPEFTTDDIVVEVNDASKLVIRAAYDAEIGQYGKQVRQRDMKQELTLPEYVHVDTVSHVLTPDGKLVIDITLKDEAPYKCEVTTEEIE